MRVRLYILLVAARGRLRESAAASSARRRLRSTDPTRRRSGAISRIPGLSAPGELSGFAVVRHGRDAFTFRVGLADIAETQPRPAVLHLGARHDGHGFWPRSSSRLRIAACTCAS